MIENKQDELIRAYTMLISMRKYIGQMTEYSVSETYVREFHTALDKLEDMEISVSEYRIPSSEVEPKLLSSFYAANGQSQRNYSQEKYVEKSFLLLKLDEILGYFEIITSEKPRKIGFSN